MQLGIRDSLAHRARPLGRAERIAVAGDDRRRDAARRQDVRGGALDPRPQDNTGDDLEPRFMGAELDGMQAVVREGAAVSVAATGGSAAVR